MADENSTTMTETPKLGYSLLKGAVFMVLGLFCYSTVNALFKMCEQEYSMAQVVFFRNAFALLPVLAMIHFNKEWPTLKTTKIKSHLFLAVIGVISLAFLFKSIILLPLADATVLMFSSSLFMTALSAPMLGEKVGIQRWLAVLVGFAGVLVIAKPSGDVLNLGVVLGALSALMQGIILLRWRALSTSESSTSMTFYFCLICAAMCMFALPFQWLEPTKMDWVILITLGLGSGLGQFFVTQATKYVPAYVSAPMFYTMMIWGVLYGLILFDEVPTISLYIGGALVIGSGLFVVYRENKLKKLENA